MKALLCRIQGQKDSRIRIEEIKYFNPKKWFLSSRKRCIMKK
jgi:hypothetical protein